MGVSMFHFLALVLVAGCSESYAPSCSKACQEKVQQLTMLGVPLAPGQNRLWWQPGQGVTSLDLPQFYQTFPVTPDLWHSWHEITIDVVFSDFDLRDKVFSGYHMGGHYSVNVSGIEASFTHQCPGRRCTALEFSSDKPSLWALGCDEAPCGCAGHCPSVGCWENVELSLLEFPLTVNQTLVWTPMTAEERLFLYWSDKTKLRERIELVSNASTEFKPSVLKITGDVNECRVEIENLGLAVNCSEIYGNEGHGNSGNQGHGNRLLTIQSHETGLFTLGCLKEEHKEPPVDPASLRASSMAWVGLGVAPVVMGVGVVVFLVVRWNHKAAGEGVEGVLTKV